MAPIYHGYEDPRIGPQGIGIMRDLSEWIKEEEGIYECPDCGSMFPRESLIGDLNVAPNQHGQCPTCGKYVGEREGILWTDELPRT